MRYKDKVKNQRNEINNLIEDIHKILRIKDETIRDLSIELKTLVNISEVDQQIIEEQNKVIGSPEYMLDGMNKDARAKLLSKYCKDPDCDCKFVLDPMGDPEIEAYQQDQADYLGGIDE